MCSRISATARRWCCQGLQVLSVLGLLLPDLERILEQCSCMALQSATLTAQVHGVHSSGPSATCAFASAMQLGRQPPQIWKQHVAEALLRQATCAQMRPSLPSAFPAGFPRHCWEMHRRYLYYKLGFLVRENWRGVGQPSLIIATKRSYKA